MNPMSLWRFGALTGWNSPAAPPSRRSPPPGTRGRSSFLCSRHECSKPGIKKVDPEPLDHASRIKKQIRSYLVGIVTSFSFPGFEHVAHVGVPRWLDSHRDP